MFGGSGFKKLLRQRLYVTLHSGEVLSAVLMDATKELHTYVDVKMATPNGMQPAQGTLYIDPAKIHYYQLIPADAAV